MNKIEVKDEINKQVFKLDEDTSIYCTSCSNDLELEVYKDVKVFMYVSSSNVNIRCDINSNFVLNIFSVNSTLNVDLDLNSDDIELDYAYSTINLDDNKYVVNINHNMSNIKSNIVNHGLNMENNDLTFVINAKACKDILNINTNQDSKIILVKEKSAFIKPNLLVDNDDIVANHSAYIGDFKKNDIFYLSSRGLSEEDCKRLLAKSFLIGNMKDITFRQVQMIKDKLNLYWR